MTRLGIYPLVRDLALFLEVLHGQVPGPRYAAYARSDVALEQCRTVYVAGWDAREALVGCYEVSVTPLQMLDRSEVGRVVGFFRGGPAPHRTRFMSPWSSERWHAYAATGIGLREVAGA